MSEPKKILVIRLKQIGDALLSLPVCNSLKVRYPDAQIDYLVYQHIAPLLEHQPSITNLLTITPEERDNKQQYIKKIFWVRKQKYDLVIDLINVPITAIMSFLSGAHTLGFDKKRWRKYLYNVTVPHSDEGDTLSKKLEILAGLNDRIEPKRDWQISVTEREIRAVKTKLLARGLDLEKPFIYVSAASRREYKFWPIEYFVTVLNHLIETHGVQLIINWYPGPEGEFVEKMLGLMGNPTGVIADMQFSLRELAATISISQFFFGNDGGPNHIAVGTGVPSLAIFSPINEKQDWLPVANPKHQGIDLKDALSLNKHQYRERKSEFKSDLNKYYRQITAEMVIEKLDSMLQSFGVRGYDNVV